MTIMASLICMTFTVTAEVRTDLLLARCAVANELVASYSHTPHHIKEAALANAHFFSNQSPTPDFGEARAFFEKGKPIVRHYFKLCVDLKATID